MDQPNSSSPMPDFGRRLLPHVIQQLAVDQPERVVFCFPKTSDPADGFHDVTNKTFANAVNRMAWWIEESYGKPESNTFPAIGYIGPNDLRYQLLAIAAVTVGYKMLYLSRRNSMEGHLSLIDQVKCLFWAFSQENIKPVAQILEERRMKAVQLPELLNLLEVAQVPVYPYTKTFQEARQDPFVVLQTSGSTGLPKPINVVNGNIATIDAAHLLPLVEGRMTVAQNLKDSLRVYSALPLYHAASIYMCCCGPLFNGYTMILGPITKPVSLEVVDQMLDHAQVQAATFPPAVLEEISQDAGSLAKLAKLQFVVVTGGPLDKKHGDQVNKVCPIWNVPGSTEGSWYATVQPDGGDDWNYIHYHPSVGFTYKQYNEELWEQFHLRDPKLDLFQAYFQTFPNEEETSTKDLFLKHPSKPDRWLYQGRADDLIVFSNGEKLNPASMESCINEHPAVRAVLVVGYGAFQPVVLIELHQSMPTNPKAAQALKSSLWEVIKKANLQVPSYGQIYPDYIIFAATEKPFVRTDKGNVARQQSISLYKQEIEAFYAEKASSKDNSSIDGTSLQSIQDGLHRLVNQILPEADISVTDDLFEAGMDSIRALHILAKIRPLYEDLNIDATKVNARFIYLNNTIEEIAQATEKHMRPNTVIPPLQNDLQKMEDYLIKYTADLQKLVKLPVMKCVLLTGSTGSFGSYILSNLYSDPRVGKIYCLNRTADARERQIVGNKAKGLASDFPHDRFEFIHSDLYEPNLGLTDADYGKLLKEVTHIIHAQWHVDFNYDIDSFELHMAGVRKLGDFALQAVYKPNLLFVSTIGAVKNQSSNIITPEAVWQDHTAGEGGYGCGKLVSEWILEKMNKSTGLSCSICRFGQLGGPIDEDLGQWKEHEWVPSIIASSKYLKAVPDTLSSANRIDWVPVNIASKVVLELMGLGDRSRTIPAPLEFYHIVNPNPTTWGELLPAVTEYFGPSVSVVPWSVWLDLLEKSEAQGDFARNPALKLLGFFQGLDNQEKRGIRLPILDTKNTQAKSKELHSIGPMTKEWMAQFLEDWGRGLLA